MMSVCAPSTNSMPAKPKPVKKRSRDRSSSKPRSSGLKKKRNSALRRIEKERDARKRSE